MGKTVNFKAGQFTDPVLGTTVHSAFNNEGEYQHSYKEFGYWFLDDCSGWQPRTLVHASFQGEFVGSFEVVGSGLNVDNIIDSMNTETGYEYYR